MYINLCHIKNASNKSSKQSCFSGKHILAPSFQIEACCSNIYVLYQ